ncbi:hypothetical protein ABDK00_005210 [Niabella insulamsoli]|uniref:hypothetical protein n=1 Tax=Niabella insulamsoli TaxID=3144874 RepID=UPI0031FBD211
MDNKLLETLADISYLAGQKRYYSGDSREDIATFIWWAKEFVAFHRDTDWDRTDYILTIEAHTDDKIAAAKMERWIN